MKLIVTCGDPSGIGPELLAHLLKDDERWRQQAEFLLTGPAALWEQLGLKERPGLSFDGPPVPVGTQPGRPCAEGALIQCQSLTRGVELAQSSENAVLVTLPVNKEQMWNGGLMFMGHTAYFRSLYPKQPVTMTFKADDHWLGLATDHIPLNQVPKALDSRCLADHGRRLHEASGLPLVILGLNPHAGEGGLMGEEESRLALAVDLLKTEGIPCRGLVPADSFFAHWQPGEAVLALYHDQGLGPFKALFRGRGCQVSLGLPFRRVAPDHGTAYDLAGTGRADPSSLAQALDLALSL